MSGEEGGSSENRCGLIYPLSYNGDGKPIVSSFPISLGEVGAESNQED